MRVLTPRCKLYGAYFCLCGGDRCIKLGIRQPTRAVNVVFAGSLLAGLQQSVSRKSKRPVVSAKTYEQTNKTTQRCHDEWREAERRETEAVRGVNGVVTKPLTTYDTRCTQWWIETQRS